LSGVRSERAYGPELVQAVRRAGFGVKVSAGSVLKKAASGE